MKRKLIIENLNLGDIGFSNNKDERENYEAENQKQASPIKMAAEKQ